MRGEIPVRLTAPSCDRIASFQAVEAKVRGLDVAADNCSGRLRDKDLAAVTGRRHPRRPDARSCRRSRRRSLALQRRLARPRRGRERHDERVALRVDNRAATPNERRSELQPMALELLRIRLGAELCQQRGTSLDVAEEKGDRSLGQRAHRSRDATSCCAPSFGCVWRATQQ